MTSRTPQPYASDRSSRILLAVVTLIVLTAHGASVLCGWIWDDDSYVTLNRVVQSPNGWLTVWVPESTPQYYPLVFLGFWMQHAIVGTEPATYHAVNVLMHAGNAALLLTLLRRLGVRHAFWIAAIFAAHPMGVESVAWVTERKNVQSLLFALASMLLFLRFVEKERGGAGVWIGSFALFVAALLSKTTAIFVPPCLVMAMLWRRQTVGPRAIAAVTPYFLVGAALGLLTAYMEKTHVGAAGDAFALGALERLQLAGRTATFYVAAFMLPREQVFIYPRFEIDASRFVHWLPALFWAMAFAVAIIRWRVTRAPLLVLLWIGAALFPALGFFDVWPFIYSFVADHFAYMAMPAFALIAVLAAARVGELVPAVARLGAIVGTLSVATCIALSNAAIPKYANEEVLWRVTLDQNPEAWIAANNLASGLLREAGVLAERQQRDEALSKAEEALGFAKRAGELNPSDFRNAVNRSEAYRLLGRSEESLREIESALPNARHVSDVYWLHGRALESVGRTDEARMAFKEAAALATKRSEEIAARRELMRIAASRRELEDAIRECARIVELDLGNADMRANLGALYRASGRSEEARRTVLEAVSLPIERFSSTDVWVSASIGYLQMAVESRLEPDEALAARTIAARLVMLSGGDPYARYLQLALGLVLGDTANRVELERIEAEARTAGASRFADDVAAFLAKHPRSAPQMR
jgi:tetratricopeptide (TPR) repeat protein